MSTKIYNAWRLRAGLDIWNETHDIRTLVEDRAKTKLRAMVRMFASDHEARREILGMSLVVDKKAKPTLDTLRRVSHALWLKYREQDRASQRNAFDFKAELAIHRVGERFLVRHFEGDGMRGIFDFLGRRRGWEDFHYQNQADRPARVTARAWSERARTWDKTMRPDGTPDHQMVVEIITPNWWSRVDPFPLG